MVLRWGLLVLCGVLAAQEPPESFPWLGAINGTDVRVRGGPGDIHAVVATLAKDDVVKVKARQGEWLEVEVPGGVAAFVAAGRAARDYVREVAPGDGLVLVNDLQVRGTPDTDHPPLGELRAGDHVVVIEKAGAFYRILAPESARVFVHRHYVAPPGDAGAAAQRFAELAAVRRTALLAGGASSKALVERQDAREALQRAAEGAFSRYDEEAAKGYAERDIEGVRSALDGVRTSASEGDPLRQEAESRLRTLEQWEQARSQIKAAEKGLEEVRREMSATERRHAEDLEKLRRDLERRAREREEAAKEKASPYVATGWLRRSIPVPGQDPGFLYGLYQDNRNRTFVLESDRYDLGEYTDRLVGILAAEGPIERPDLRNRVLKVTRLEILAER